MKKIVEACICGHFETSHTKPDKYGARPCRYCDCIDYYYDYRTSKDAYDEAMERKYNERMDK